MTVPDVADIDENPVFTVVPARGRRVPLVFASPHSGRNYPADFVAASKLDPQSLRRSEDSYVDELFVHAPDKGAPLLAAKFPRAFVDPNREPYELDPTMFLGPMPFAVNSRSPRVAAGLGTIARVVAGGAEIYRDRLPLSEIERRIGGFYRPYHARLQSLVDETLAEFGRCLLVDCHSMPSGADTADIVLGDCFGASCAPCFSDTAERVLRDRGYRVARNAPYAGGFTTRSHGQPGNARHALQIEISRALYMDETTHVKTAGFDAVIRDLDQVIDALAAEITR